jgi:hypothetical protein
MSKFKISILMFSWLLMTFAYSQEVKYEEDPISGLIMAPNWELVRGNCTACHSAKFITFQRGDRETWGSMIKWMQKTQGLWQFDTKTETLILDYLSTNYAPGPPSRRRNLPPYDMPPLTHK